jgi:integrase
MLKWIKKQGVYKMAACEPYTQEQMLKMVESSSFSIGDRLRNQCIFSLECATGGRANEILKLKREDIIDSFGRIREKIYFTNTKNKTTIQVDLVNQFCIFFLKKWLKKMEGKGFTLYRTPLFPSPVKALQQKKPLSYRQVHNIYDRAHKELKLEGHYSTHSCRKTWAIETYRYYERLREEGKKVDPLLKLFATGRWKTMDAMQKYLLPLMGETKDSQENIFPELTTRFGV